MFSNINNFFEKMIQVSETIQISVADLIKRGLLYIVTASWVAFYPTYLLLIHMKVEKFFSYDVFVSGIFGIKSFLLLVFIIIIISSIYLWGFVIFFRDAILSKSKSMAIYGGIFVLISLLFHRALFDSALADGKPERLVWMSGLGFVFAVTIASYMANPLKNFLFNWMSPVIGIIASATIPIVYLNITSDIVKTGLENFKVGGGVDISVYKIDDNSVIKSGKLLLLTPDYVYLREGDSGYISISRSNETFVSVK